MRPGHGFVPPTPFPPSAVAPPRATSAPAPLTAVRKRARWHIPTLGPTTFHRAAGRLHRCVSPVPRRVEFLGCQPGPPSVLQFRESQVLSLLLPRLGTQFRLGLGIVDALFAGFFLDLCRSPRELVDECFFDAGQLPAFLVRSIGRPTRRAVGQPANGTPPRNTANRVSDRETARLPGLALVVPRSC